MKCNDVQKLLPEILSTGVSRNVREQMQMHISTCQRCSDQWNVLTKTWNMAGSYAAPKLPINSFADSVMAQTRRGKSEPCGEVIGKAVIGGIARYRLPLTAAAVAAVAVILALCCLLIDDGFRRVSPDLEIVENLDFYLNLEMVDNLELLSEYEVVKSFD